MQDKRKYMKLTKTYLKKTGQILLKAFSMGFDDGMRGKEQTAPALPSPEDGINYAALLFASELYKRGYKSGKGGEKIV